MHGVSFLGIRFLCEKITKLTFGTPMLKILSQYSRSAGLRLAGSKVVTGAIIGKRRMEGSWSLCASVFAY